MLELVCAEFASFKKYLNHRSPPKIVSEENILTQIIFGCCTILWKHKNMATTPGSSQSPESNSSDQTEDFAPAVSSIMPKVRHLSSSS